MSPSTSFPLPLQLIFKDVTIKGSLLGSPEDAKEMVDLVASKGILCKTQAYDLQSVHQMMVSRHADGAGALCDLYCQLLTFTTCALVPGRLRQAWPCWQACRARR